MRRLFLPVGITVLAIALGMMFFGVSEGATKSANPAPVRLTADAGPTSAASLASGEELFAENCSTCHGAEAKGSALAPNLQGLGSATVDLWVSTGLMPLSVPTSEPVRKPDKFTNEQTLELANWVQSLTPGVGVAIPTVDLKGANVAVGFDMFAENCAPCHTITGAGDALSGGLEALPLHGVTATNVAEAIETGPGNMPRMYPGALTKAEANDVVAYVTEDIEHPSSPGGLGLGGVGPVAEGFVGLFLGVGACMLIALWIGERTEREDPEHAHDELEPTHV
jgi:ubiquinol-cytochrome c reductase cytochrome c subunit